MGYRSDVGLCLTATGKKALDAKLTALDPDAETTQYIHELLHSPYKKREDQDSGAVAWVWESVKWYSEYESVAFIDTLLESLDDADYFFIRVGESEDDTEIHGGFQENPFGMCLMRGIGLDF